MPRRYVDLSVSLETAEQVMSFFPYKIKGASAGFTRAVAIFTE